MALASTDKRAVLKQIGSVTRLLLEEMSAHSARGRVASGLATEGYAGGYYQALLDVEAALRHGYPNDPRGYWARARRELKANSSPTSRT